MLHLLSAVAFAVTAVWSVPGPSVDSTAAPLPDRPPTGAVEDQARASDVTSSAPGVDPAHTGRPAVGPWPDIEMVDASGEQRVRVGDAVAAFRRAGLMLPDLTIEFHAERSACRGHDGLFRAKVVPWRILVCSEATFVVSHELAHAWEAANLDDADRERYLERRGLDTWDSGDVEWGERGVEDAAFHVQQNLMERHVDLGSDTWRERTAAYSILTGRRSPLLVAAESGAARPGLHR